jgi:hypothetical protein
VSSKNVCDVGVLSKQHSSVHTSRSAADAYLAFLPVTSNEVYDSFHPSFARILPFKLRLLGCPGNAVCFPRMVIKFFSSNNRFFLYFLAVTAIFMYAV